MAKRLDMEWRKSERFKTRSLLYVYDDFGTAKFSGWVLRACGNNEYAVHYYHNEICRFTSRTDARLYCEFRAEMDLKELTNS